jgi:hypothetical protein
MKLNFISIFLPLLALILLYIIFKMIHYLVKQNYIVECFTDGPIQNTSNITHTVDLPLTTKTSCQNFCGPNARCAITGQQCFTDIDCPGCQPYSPPLPKTQSLSETPDCIPGNNDAGKLTVGVTPTYSPLTSGYGTRERIITDDLYSKAPQANFGVDTWTDSYKESKKLFDTRYKPNQLQFMPNYPEMYTLTGMFSGDGPLPSNY